MSVYFFYGQETYLIENEIKKLKNKLLDLSCLSINYKVIDNPDFPTLEQTLLSQPMMFGNMLIVIRCEKYFLDKDKIEFTDKELKIIESAIKNVVESLNIVFLCIIPRDSLKKIDTRRKLFKIISQNSKAKEYQEYKSYDKDLHLFINNLAKNQELKIDNNAIQAIIEQVGTNLESIANYFEKIKLYIYPEKKVDIKIVKENCPISEDIFLFLDKIIAGDKDQAMIEYKSLCFKKHPLEIIALLNSTFSNLIFIKSNENKMSQKLIAQSLKMHEYRVKLTSEKIKKNSLESLVKFKKRIIDTEYKIKTGKMDTDLAFELLLLKGIV